MNLIKEQEKTNDSFIGMIFDLRCTHARLRYLSVEKDFFLSSMKTLDLCFDFDNDGLNGDKDISY